jgi:hypothetical protein
MSCDRGRRGMAALLPPTSTTAESPCQNPTITRRESRRKSPERRANKKSNNAGRLDRMQPPRAPSPILRRSPRVLARRVPRTQREALLLQSSRLASGARGAATSRPGCYPDVARSVSRCPTATSRVEIRRGGGEPPRRPITRITSACAGFFRVPLSPCRLRRAVRSHRCRERRADEPSSRGGRCAEVRGPTARSARLPNPL